MEKNCFFNKKKFVLPLFSAKNQIFLVILQRDKALQRVELKICKW
jgi:hypothetical protein